MEVSIRDAVNIHFRDIGQDPKVHDVTYENGQARERTQILMDIANTVSYTHLIQSWRISLGYSSKKSTMVLYIIVLKN